MSSLVSVVIPCFNLAAYLDETVQSVLDQTFQDFEIVIVDDGSDDAATRHMLASYRRPKTRIVRIENRGLPGARNRGLEEAVGRYVSFLDADDLYEPSFLERTVATLEADPSKAFASCWLRAFGEDDFSWAPESCSFPRLLAEDTVCTAALMRRGAVEAVGGFDESGNVYGYEDWALAIAVVERGGEGLILPEFLFRYRIRAGSMTSECTRPENHARVVEYLVDKHAATYRRHFSGVIEVITDRIEPLEEVLPVAPSRPEVDSKGDGWRASILRLENHRRALEEMARHGQTPVADRAVVWGNLRHLEPLSKVWGTDRGQPVDRYFIERFLQSNRRRIRGSVLEVKDPGYALRFGEGLERVEVVDIAEGNPEVTLVADLSQPDALPTDEFHCFVLTQTMQFIYEAEEVVRNAFHTLKPGGMVLATLPCVSRLDYESGRDGDFWRFTPASARRLFSGVFGAENVAVETFGNVLTCTAFLQGLASSELATEELEHHDPYFPLLVTVRAVKPAPPSEMAPAGQRLEGCQDRATCRAITGWAWDPSDPDRRLWVELREGERLLGSVRADRLRPDLAEAGKGDGKVAFFFTPEEDLHGDESRQISARVVGSERDLPNSPRQIECVCGRPEKGADETREAGADESSPTASIRVTDVTVEGAGDIGLHGSFVDLPNTSSRIAFPWLDIVGWTLGAKAPVDAVELVYRGKVFQRVPLSVRRPDLRAAFPDMDWSIDAGFAARTSLLGIDDDAVIGLRAVMNDRAVTFGRIHLRVEADHNWSPPVTLVLDPAAMRPDDWNHVLDQPLNMDRVLVLDRRSDPDEPTGHPGLGWLDPGKDHWNPPEDTSEDGFLWLTDTGATAGPFLEAAVSRLVKDPDASFACWITSDVGPTDETCTLESVLSGRTLGSAVLVRVSAIRSIGGFDSSSPSCAASLWDICIRLVLEGRRGLIVTGDAEVNAPTLAERVGNEGVRWLFRKHERAYRTRLTGVILDAETHVGTTLRENHSLERLLASTIEPILRGRRRERDRLGGKLRHMCRVKEVEGLARARGFDWGDFRRSEPISSMWGSERGTCIDRFYIERFLASHSADVRGSVLEVQDSVYAIRYGGESLQRCDVVDIDPTNQKANVVADLQEGGALGSRAYDCVILTQTLLFIYCLNAALQECARVLKPGGVLLVTVPCVARIDAESGLDGDFWRFSVEGIRRPLAAAFPGSTIDVRPHGNPVVAMAFLVGLAAEEVDPAEIRRTDQNRPLLLTARVVKHASGSGRP
jgi:glycosyltransferase involved in cell wall biosynthesis/SAM-dependent methyltransferase